MMFRCHKIIPLMIKRNKRKLTKEGRILLDKVRKATDCIELSPKNGWEPMRLIIIA